MRRFEVSEVCIKNLEQASDSLNIALAYSYGGYVDDVIEHALNEIDYLLNRVYCPDLIPAERIIDSELLNEKN